MIYVVSFLIVVLLAAGSLDLLALTQDEPLQAQAMDSLKFASVGMWADSVSVFRSRYGDFKVDHGGDTSAALDEAFRTIVHANAERNGGDDGK